MRILILNYEFPPLGGGAANATFYLLKELGKQKNLKVDLITSSVDEYKEEQFSPNIKIYYLNIGKKNKNLHYQTSKDLLLYSWKAYWFCKKLICHFERSEESYPYNLIHAFFGIPCGFIALLFAKPYIVSLRGSDVPFYNPRFYWPDKLFFSKLSKIVWKNAKAVIANSQDLKKLALKTALNQKIEVIPNGVDTAFFKPSTISHQPSVILFVGRLIRRKGVNFLLQAFAKLPKKYQKTSQIWLVGAGLEKQNLINLAKELNILTKVKFLGIKNKKELIDIYNQAKIFVLPSLNEGMSNTLLEAMACGLPIIATNTGDAKELIKNNGLIIKKGNVRELEKAILKLLKNKKTRNNMAKLSRIIAEGFKWKDIADKYIKEYLKCAL